jgi:hypothetical protein
MFISIKTSFLKFNNIQNIEHNERGGVGVGRGLGQGNS